MFSFNMICFFTPYFNHFSFCLFGYVSECLCVCERKTEHLLNGLDLLKWTDIFAMAFALSKQITSPTSIYSDEFELQIE